MKFLAEIVTLMISDDVELSAECIERGRTFLENPVKTIQEIKKSRNLNCEVMEMSLCLQ